MFDAVDLAHLEHSPSTIMPLAYLCSELIAQLSIDKTHPVDHTRF
jgi:hypothetical protein